MPELKGAAYLRRRLVEKRWRVLLRYRYYDMKNRETDLGKTIPDNFRYLKSTLGWCTRAVDSLADRLIFRGFGNDNFDLMQVYQMNNADILFDSAILCALISACGFIYISAGDDGFPRLQVIDGANATGIIDPITGMLQEGYAVLERDVNDVPILEAYFKAGQTDYYRKGDAVLMQPETVVNTAPYPLLVPVIYRPDATRPFGHSRISRACMQIMQDALKTLRLSKVSAEFYSFPQKYVTGLAQDAEQMDKWKATVTSMLAFTKDDDGDKPTLGQFSQQSMSPYTEQLRTYASLFSGETGLTLDDLGFVSENPSSAEAIKATHENLRLTARKAQRTFGTGFLNAGYLAACVRDNFPYQRQQIYLTTPLWEPIFEPDAAMLSTIGDGIVKVNQAIPGYFGNENTRALTGIDGETE